MSKKGSKTKFGESIKRIRTLFSTRTNSNTSASSLFRNRDSKNSRITRNTRGTASLEESEIEVEVEQQQQREQLRVAISNMSRRQENGEEGISPDQMVEITLKAKQKAQRKKGEMMFGPSVAMLAHKQQHKNSSTKRFRKFLVSSVTKSKLMRQKPTPDQQGEAMEAILNLTEKSKEEIDFLTKALKDVVLFSQYPEVTLMKLAAAMQLEEFLPDIDVCKQGVYQSQFYIIKEGELEVFLEEKASSEVKSSILKKKSSSVEERLDDEEDEQSVKPLTPGIVLRGGIGFGELGMNFGSPRERTIRTLTPAKLYVLERENYRKIVENEFLRKNEFMLEALHKVKVLDKLKPEQISKMIPHVELVTFPAGRKIITKGTFGGTFYMIISGSVECVVMEEQKKSITKPPSTLNASTKTDVVTELKDDIFDDTSVLEIDEAEQKKISDQSNEKPLVEKRYAFGEGGYFGERAWLENDRRRKADVIATTEVELLAITYDSFAEHLEGLTQAFEENIKLQALENAPFFNTLSREEASLMQRALTVSTFKNKEYIIKEGTKNDNFYIIRDGEVEVSRKLDSDATNNFEIATLERENYFGEGSILLEKPPNASVIAKGNVTCYVLSKKNFKKFIKDDKLEMLRTTFNERNRRAIARTREKKNEILANVTLREVRPLATLGSGCFGLVKLADVKGLKSCFALKILEKGAVVRNNQEVNVINEKEILLQCDHPFIVRLYRTFKDRLKLYYLMEFIQGGEMFQFLHHVKNGSLDNSTARFYVACVVDALDYLHKKRIIYRDLKPENLMIDEEGYGKVVDFGFAKKLVYKTFTLCGTAQYLAPEILLSKGYGKSVDFWTLGILIYELFTGTTPFKRRDRNEQFNAIKKENRIKFNRRWRNADEAKELVCLLLHKVPKKRLGCRSSAQRGFKEVKDHRWFTSIDFQKLYFKELTPPWKPRINGMKDVRNFEEYDPSDNPLTGKYDHKAGDSDVWKDF